jgi:hypothetical protein
MPKHCSDGAIIGCAIGPAENDSYTSQITVLVSDELNGETVVCAHDNGTNFTEIGSAILNIMTGIIVCYCSYSVATFTIFLH